MSTLTVKISGSTVQITEGSLSIKSRVDDKDTAVFQVKDDTGTLAFSKGQPVLITDSVQGTLFSGFLNKPTMINLYPNATNMWSCDCVNQFYVPAKRVHHRRHKGQHAAPIVALQVQQYLEPDGVSGNFGLDWSELQSEWAAGTLSGTISATNFTTGNVGAGNLELTRGGATYTSTSAAVSLPTQAAIAFSGYASSVASNPICSRQIWTGSMLINNVGVATLFFDVWISSTSPSIVASVDFTCSDGTIFSSTLLFDTQEISNVLTNDLSGLANDQWYTRDFLFQSTAFAGKTITSVSLVLAGKQAGTYSTFFKNIYFNNNGTIVPFFTSTLVANNQAALVGYSNVSVSVVQAASAPSQIVAISAGAYSGVNLLQASTVNWNATVPTGCSLLVESSIDNQASWQAVTNGGSIPNLLPGVQLSVVNLSYRATLKVGPDPSQNTLGLTGFQTILTPSYAATKTDLVQAYGNAGGATAFSAGTLTSTQVVGNQLTLSGFQRNYATLDGSDQGFYTSGIGNALAPFDNQIQLQMIGAGDVRSRMDPAGQWQNFTTECDMQVPANPANVGLVYRTTNWVAGSNTFAYVISLSSTGISLGHGSNAGSSGSYTNLVTTTVALTAGSTHRLKVIVNGNSHIVFLDGAQLISTTDATFTATGYLGLRLSNSTGTTDAFFNNFGVVPALSGTWQSAALNIASPTTYGNSAVMWDVDGIPDSTCSIAMQSSVDGGSTFQSVSNGAPIPNLAAGQSLAAKTLILLATLTANSASLVPVLNGASVFVLQQFNATGSRTNAPLAWDSVQRLPVASGWSNASNGQAYTQAGTGTTAVAGNEATIANTTGDVHMSLANSTGNDEDGTVRFQLSASTITAGLELRYSNANTFYRLQASTTTISIVKAGGPMVTLATVSMALSINTFYRMHFRVTGSGVGGHVSLNGSVWLDGTTEPTAFVISATD